MSSTGADDGRAYSHAHHLILMETYRMWHMEAVAVVRKLRPPVNIT